MMLKFSSERQLARTSMALIAGLVACAGGFYFLQNQLGVIGGEIALPKLMWLAYALLFWLGLPVLVMGDSRTPPLVRSAFASLFALMAARVAAEGVMLYITNSWSPLYGIAHDLACMAALWFFLVRAWLAGEPRSSPVARTVFLHGIVTSMLFFPEIWFALYMHTNFHTKGAQAIYFVPDSEQHRTALRITSAVVLALTVYLPLFLGSWLHDPARRHRP
jgi:hypothetical protein